MTPALAQQIIDLLEEQSSASPSGSYFVFSVIGDEVGSDSHFSTLAASFFHSPQGVFAGLISFLGEAKETAEGAGDGETVGVLQALEAVLEAHGVVEKMGRGALQ